MDDPNNPQNAAPPPIQPLPPSSPPPASGSPENQVRNWNMACHLSVLSLFVIPFGNFLGPFIVWQIKKQEIPSVETHAKAAINFQLTLFIAVLIAVAAGFVLSFFCVGYLLFPVAALLAVCGIIFPVIAGIKASEGKTFEYPYSILFLK